MASENKGHLSTTSIRELFRSDSTIEETKESPMFDIWKMIKRPHTTVDPYTLVVKYRMARSHVKRTRIAERRKVVSRRKKRESEVKLESDRAETALSFDTALTDGDEHVSAEEYDFDVEDDTELASKLSHTQLLYLKGCKEMKVNPSSYILKALNTDRVSMPHHSIGSVGTKALALALVGNSDVQTVNLTDNDIGVKGAEYIAEIFHENNFVKELMLSENMLGAQGVQFIVDAIKKHDCIHKLDLSGNGLKEYDAEVIRPLIEDTTNLKHLLLAHNEFREHGGEIIADALLWNDTMESLDLSWNHLRQNGAVAIAEALQENSTLKKINLAWNGFYMDGCKALSRALEDNSTLLELDLTCNRINKDCLEKLIHGLRRNTTLKVLRLGLNPITPAGANMILSLLNEKKDSGIIELDLTGQLVEKSFVSMLNEIQSHRNIKVIHGPVRGQDAEKEDDEKALVDENPIIVLMEFGKLMGFRLMDLFSILDKDGSKSLDHDEIRHGLRLVNIPLSDESIDVLINKLDVDGDGEIDFGELIAAQMEHRRKMSFFYAAKEDEESLEDTEIGRVRLKLQRLMAKKLADNPEFKRQSRMLLEQMGLDVAVEFQKQKRDFDEIQTHIQEKAKREEPIEEEA
ncbi:hypothetical protein ACJMK2_032307 [Sinanodonta woodiana]|uniref:EF-hand domain-containing protein n=1 Tax=Sinanodonta woodiana TaxID=1069815 RepID=A0ABD3X2S5_SINWO